MPHSLQPRGGAAPGLHGRRRWLWVLVAMLSLLTTAGAVTATTWTKGTNSAPATTGDHVADKGWWPTKGTPDAATFLGDAACLQCHTDMKEFQNGNAMPRAASLGPPDLTGNVPGSFRSGAYAYSLVNGAAGTTLQVTAGDASATFPISWTFGAGRHGQTYLLDNEGTTYEAQVSSFVTQHLGLTPGHADLSSGTLSHGIGNRLSMLEKTRCFACHTTAWSEGGKLSTANIVPGVHCEACHGPGQQHVAEVRAGRLEKAATSILNPARLDPVARTDYCGACHRTSMDIELNGAPDGLSSIRFQPYRLEKSRCWIATEDVRLTCTGCHNPHKAVVRDPAFYDRKCLACHTAAAAQLASPSNVQRKAVRSCPVARSNCTSCHMPKYNVPEMHSDFVDHFIRIVRLQPVSGAPVATAVPRR